MRYTVALRGKLKGHLTIYEEQGPELSSPSLASQLPLIRSGQNEMSLSETFAASKGIL